MQQYDLEAYSLATAGVTALAACVAVHQVSAYGSWEANVPTLGRRSHPAWIWFQAISIAADAAAVQLRERAVGARKRRSRGPIAAAAAVAENDNR
jgi:hypothetical protein